MLSLNLRLWFFLPVLFFSFFNVSALKASFFTCNEDFSLAQNCQMELQKRRQQGIQDTPNDLLEEEAYITAYQPHFLGVFHELREYIKLKNELDLLGRDYLKKLDLLHSEHHLDLGKELPDRYSWEDFVRENDLPVMYHGKFKCALMNGLKGSFSNFFRLYNYEIYDALLLNEEIFNRLYQVSNENTKSLLDFRKSSIYQSLKEIGFMYDSYLDFKKNLNKYKYQKTLKPEQLDFYYFLDFLYPTSDRPWDPNYSPEFFSAQFSEQLKVLKNNYGIDLVMNLSNFLKFQSRMTRYDFWAFEGSNSPEDIDLQHILIQKWNELYGKDFNDDKILNFIFLDNHSLKLKISRSNLSKSLVEKIDDFRKSPLYFDLKKLEMFHDYYLDFKSQRTSLIHQYGSFSPGEREVYISGLE